eukprot:15484189-Alexandrium_andersonii.AAC.1
MQRGALPEELGQSLAEAKKTKTSAPTAQSKTAQCRVMQFQAAACRFGRPSGASSHWPKARRSARLQKERWTTSHLCVMQVDAALSCLGPFLGSRGTLGAA